MSFAVERAAILRDYTDAADGRYLGAVLPPGAFGIVDDPSYMLLHVKEGAPSWTVRPIHGGIWQLLQDIGKPVRTPRANSDRTFSLESMGRSEGLRGIAFSMIFRFSSLQASCRACPETRTMYLLISWSISPEGSLSVRGKTCQIRPCAQRIASIHRSIDVEDAIACVLQP